MTRAERLAEQVTRAKDRLVEQRKQLAKVQRDQRKAERADFRERCFQVGELVASAKLFALDNATLAALFAALTPLVETAHPVVTLEALMRRISDSPAVPVEGYADLRSCVTSGASGTRVH
jgi:hypothetical protein